jgi:hypothetical protein
MDRLAGMLEQYGKFGLDKSQMAALKDILQNRNPGPGVTNELITSAGRNDLFTGKGYVTPGINPNMPKGLQEIKNTPGIEQSRQNLLNFIERYKKGTTSTSAPTPKIPAAQSAPVTQPTSPNRGGALVRNSGGALVDTTQRINTNTAAPSGPRGMYTRLPSSSIVTSNATSAAQTPAGKSVVKSVLNRSAPLVIGGLDAGVQISQGENPYVAGGRAFASMLGGTIGSTGAMFVGGEGTPLDYLTMSGGYNEGSKVGTDMFNKALNMFGYKQNTPSAQTTQQIKAPKQSTIPPNSQNKPEFADLHKSATEAAFAKAKEYKEEIPKKPESSPDLTPTSSVYNAQERVKKYGVKKAEDMGMMEWAKANKELAAKVKPGQSGYDAIQFALGKTEVKPEDIRGYMDDTGRSAEDVRGILGKGTQVETVISKGNPDVMTIGPIPKVGGPEVEIPAGNFSEMSQSIQDLFAPRQETGATPFDFGFQNVMDQPFSQPFLMNFLKKVPGTK